MTRITRRGILAAGTAALAMPALHLGRASGRPFTICSWGGATGDMMKTVAIDAFAKAKSIEIVQAAPINYPKIVSMVQENAVEWDVIAVGGAFAFRSPDSVEELDYSVINVDGIDNAWYNERFVTNFAGATLIAYNTDAFTEETRPKSWKDFWNIKDFPGPRALYNTLEGNYEAALLADGMGRSEIYPATSEKVERALAKLAEIKPHVLVWWKSGAQPAQLLSTGEVAMSSSWNAPCTARINEGGPLNLTFDDAIIFKNGLNVVKGTSHRELAMEFLNYFLSQEVQDALLQYGGAFAPVRGSSVAKATEADQRFLPTAHLDNALVTDYKSTAWFLDTYSDQWQKFLLD